MQLTLQASNIKCGGCVSNIENGLKEIENIETVNVDLETNRVMIEGGKLDQVTIESKLSELGYPVKN